MRPHLFFIWALCCALAVLAAPASGGSFYVDGAAGDDGNDCRSASPGARDLHEGPCATIQSAIDKSKEIGDTINVADWDKTYAAVSVVYYRAVAIVGNCNNPARVKVESIVGADHDILQIGCLSTPLVLSRQMSIINLLNVHFLANPNGIHVSAQVNSTVNYKGGIVIEGGAVNHAAAGYNSYIPITGDITINNAVTFSCFANAQRHSDIDFGEKAKTGLFGAGAKASKGRLACADDTSKIYLPASFDRGGFTVAK